MARRFTAASSEVLYAGAAGLAGFDFRFGTVASVVRFVSFVSAGTIFEVNDNATNSLEVYVDNLARMRSYDGASDALGTTGITSGTPWLLGWTKDTGTATPRFHALNLATSTWTHTAGSVTLVNAAATTAFGIGGYTSAGSDAIDAEILQVGAWSGRAMSDGEFERLARGKWLNQAPDFYEQFSQGRESGDMVHTMGRYPVRQTARTGTTRTGFRMPSGFRVDAPRRRR